jgi:hypothetical protein
MGVPVQRVTDVRRSASHHSVVGNRGTFEGVTDLLCVFGGYRRFSCTVNLGRSVKRSQAHHSCQPLTEATQDSTRSPYCRQFVNRRGDQPYA